MAENDIRKEMEQLRTDFAALRADVSELTKAYKNAGASKAESVKHNVEEELRRQRDALREKLDEVRSRGNEVKDKVEAQVGVHPYTSLLTAFGVGFILAKLVNLGDRH